MFPEILYPSSLHKASAKICKTIIIHLYYYRYVEKDGETVAENVTELEENRRCCDGHILDTNYNCIPEDNRVLVCGNATCNATQNLECITFF